MAFICELFYERLWNLGLVEIGCSNNLFANIWDSLMYLHF